MRHEEGTFSGAGGVELFFKSRRPAGGGRAAVALVHGLGDHSGGLQTLAAHLASLGLAVYGLDLRGHGRSAGPRGHIERWSEFRQDLRGFLGLVSEREPGMPLFVAGHSLGGLIALEYALNHPDRLAGVIAMSPALRLVMSPVAQTGVRMLAALAPWMPMAESGGAEELSRDPEVLRRLQADLLRHPTLTFGLAREILDAARWSLEHAGKLQVPLLLQYGLADTITPADGSRRFFEAVTYPEKVRHEYPQTLHRPFDDLNREEVLSDLSDWLAHQLEQPISRCEMIDRRSIHVLPSL